MVRIDYCFIAWEEPLLPLVTMHMERKATKCTDDRCADAQMTDV